MITGDDDSAHLAGARARYLFANADNDRGMTSDNVRTLGATLQAAGLTATNLIVPNATHGHAMSDTAAWNAEAIEWALGQLRESSWPALWPDPQGTR